MKRYRHTIFFLKPHLSGLELLEKFQIVPNVIFTTAYTEFALDSYNYNAIDYLLKPFEFDRFQVAVNKAEHWIASQKKSESFFFIKDGFKNIKIEFESILFIKGSGDYLDITTKDKVFSTRMTFIEKLPSFQFVSVHQSYLINILNIDKIENSQVCMESHKIAIANNYKKLLFRRLNLE